MGFNTYVVLITYYAALLGLAAAALADSAGPFFLASAGAAIGTSLILNIRGKKLIPAYVWNVLAVAVLLVFAADFLWFSTGFITAASRLLTILLALKLFDLKRTRDHLLAYLISFFLMLAAAASTTSPAFLAILSLYMAGAVWAMVAFCIKRDFYRVNPESAPLPLVFGARFFASIIGVSAMAIAATFILFLIIPRIGAGFFEKDRGQAKVTGFTERVDIGAMGPLRGDPTVVMRVGVKGGRDGSVPLYMRGAALEYYDGTGWSSRLTSRRLVRKNRAGTFMLGRPAAPLMEQDIVLEPMDTEVIFAASNPSMIEGAFPGIWADGSGTLRLPFTPYSRIEYKAWSAPAPLTGDPPGPQYLDNSYLDRKPASLRVRQLAALITSKARARTDEEKARAIERYLRARYSYTLDPSGTQGVAPLEDFLFYSRQGYCEHFATAMAVLLRYSGVPSRVITGFLQGEWSSVGNYYIVRQQDAHSWVEAYINGRGWTAFDPTPPSAIARPGRYGLFLYLDLLRWEWDRYIVHYTLSDQRRLAGGIGGGAMNAGDRLLSIRPGKAALYRAGGILALALLAALIIAYLRARGRGAPRKTPRYYIRMEDILGRKGLKRANSETPAEFAARADDPMVDLITYEFQRHRYSGAVPDKDAMGRIEEAIEGLGKKRR